MKRLLLFLLSIVITSGVTSQTVQFASEIKDFSTQAGMSNEYTADQLLGKPNAMPQGGDNACSWMPKDPNSYMDYVVVGFEKAMPIKQVAIFENFNAGAIQSVYLQNKKGKFQSIHSIKKGFEAKGKNVFRLTFEMTDFDVYGVKVVLFPSQVPGNNQLDAIGISDSEKPIEAKINAVEIAKFDSEPENLGTGVNTNYADFVPAIAPDGKTLYFIRRDYPKNIGGGSDDIWISKYKNGVWSTALNAGAPLNNSRINSASSITPDGNTMLMLYYKEDGSSEHGVHISRKTENGWSQPVIQEIENYFNDDRYNEFNLSNDGKTMIMTVKRDFGKGGKDLHVSFKEGENKWSEPMNMGDVINTASDENSPFLASDNKTLYFSSKGFSTYGSADIFMTKRLDESWMNWTEPVNLGNKINTPDWDAYFRIPASADYVYYTSTNGTASGELDIFRLKLPEEVKPAPVFLVKGRVLNKETKQAVKARLNYENLKTNKIVGEATSNPKTGEYQIVLPYGENYGYFASVSRYYAVNQNLDATNLKEYKEVVQDIYLSPIKVGEVVRLNNIFFETAKADLKNESFAELDRVVKLLKENQSLKIQIQGHTDNVGSDVANQSLSDSRAKSVVNYLVSKGVNSERLLSKGFGETQPLKTNDTEEGRAWNRRVEFKIL